MRFSVPCIVLASNTTYEVRLEGVCHSGDTDVQACFTEIASIPGLPASCPSHPSKRKQWRCSKVLSETSAFSPAGSDEAVTNMACFSFFWEHQPLPARFMRRPQPDRGSSPDDDDDDDDNVGDEVGM
ncbi:hypothetical protein CMUS01_00535 [Colletotrichum musicola]|uniref:Uncharacterized protein n=1 Tax=Colletotrichum musicola TaxID=2175873 RepID=A0A8H6NYS7_9PEZI|nr:hypothetical protein CMUS01_00535 [Colletotrichum musicola]